MTTQTPATVSEKDNTNRYVLFEDMVMSLLIVLSLIGIAIIDFAPAEGYFYWMVMILIFGIAAMGISFLQAKRGKHIMREIWIEQSLLWLGVFAALCGMLLLKKAGSLNANNISQVMLLILSLACYIDGLRIGWRFSLFGNFLGLTAVIMAYLENFMWTLYVLSAITIALTIYIDRRLIRKNWDNTHE